MREREGGERPQRPDHDTGDVDAAAADDYSDDDDGQHVFPL